MKLKEELFIPSQNGRLDKQELLETREKYTDPQCCKAGCQPENAISIARLQLMSLSYKA